MEHGTRVHVHHGTREAPARVAWLGGRFHQLRCEQPLVAARGDRLVLRQVAPPDTLGGGVVLDPGARKHGPTNDALVRLTRLARGEDPEPRARAHARAAADRDPRRPRRSPTPRERVEERIRAAGPGAVASAELDDDEYAQLRGAARPDRIARVGKDMYVHADALAEVRARVARIVEARAPSRSPGCATSWAAGARSRRRCWSASTPTA